MIVKRRQFIRLLIFSVFLYICVIPASGTHDTDHTPFIRCDKGKGQGKGNGKGNLNGKGNGKGKGKGEGKGSDRQLTVDCGELDQVVSILSAESTGLSNDCYENVEAGLLDPSKCPLALQYLIDDDTTTGNEQNDRRLHRIHRRHLRKR